VLESIASFATAAAVFVAAWQLWLTRAQSRVGFEDGLSREYRDIAEGIPVKALLGEELQEAEFEEAFRRFYRYIDLSNEQIFLRMEGRISLKTWRNWAGGIESNLGRPAFRRAWKEIKDRSGGSFSELRRLESDNFASDPKKWTRQSSS